MGMDRITPAPESAFVVAAPTAGPIDLSASATRQSRRYGTQACATVFVGSATSRFRGVARVGRKAQKAASRHFLYHNFLPNVSSSSSTCRSQSTVRMMFTGIVEEIGQVEAIVNLDSEEGGVEMTLKAGVTLERTQLGDSIAVNGTCLTVTHIDAVAQTFKVGLAPETLRCTNLGKLKTGSKVNLERSLAADGRVGGHFVQGHVDGTGIIQAKRTEKDAIWFTICPSDRAVLKYVVPKGYIAVDGTSLTVVNVTDTTFDFMMVPYTQEHVIIPSKVEGELVNLEVDITGKYIEKFLSWRD
ncbi:Riboflavin synthase [Porphyridium purpureum]|uniref:Riboflavin synthase n=1 Tax=Porphyridium purpureum TaxID=35688 RepID=A0A5J4Z320_PORPP|nr:Riboflavin synthase [Porphyridium purpureum]|eukprot:POR5305..scf295_1